MSRVSDVLLANLRHLIADLGKDGGLMSPSVYDTAQVLRLAPPAEGVWPALEWLLDQQQPDGGWGNPALPRARDLPTLATVLVLHRHSQRRSHKEAIAAGLTFLQRQAEIWAGPLPDDLTTGVELLLPRLLDEAVAAGLQVAHSHYGELKALGHRRRRLIAELRPGAGTTAAHSWEGWGVEPDPAILDGTGSVGHSPTATAYWISAAADRPALHEHSAAAQRYLARAASATEVAIPGVVPTAWPINRFEQTFALYALLIAGLLEHPRLQDVLRPQLDDLAGALRGSGIGYSDHFMPDGDDTAAAVAVLRAAGYSVSPACLQHFLEGDHYCTWPRELQASVSVNAHVLHALELCGKQSQPALQYVVERQCADGRWLGDKWNGSWLYTTSQVLIALHAALSSDQIERAVRVMLAYQRPDGSWCGHSSSFEETA